MKSMDSKRRVSANLFDNIHSILEHPKERAESTSKVPKKALE
jgi:hypothetical protein